MMSKLKRKRNLKKATEEYYFLLLVEFWHFYATMPVNRKLNGGKNSFGITNLISGNALETVL